MSPQAILIQRRSIIVMAASLFVFISAESVQNPFTEDTIMISLATRSWI
jgi:hypothetical protein